MKPLSRNQLAILETLRRVIAERHQVPSMAELRVLTGISSTNTVSYNLDRLEEKGYVVRRREAARSIDLVLQPNDPCPYCGRYEGEAMHENEAAGVGH